MTLLETLKLYQTETRIQEEETEKIKKINAKGGIIKRLLLSFFGIPTLCSIVAVILNFFVPNSVMNVFVTIIMFSPFIAFIWMTVNASKRKVVKKQSEKSLLESRKRMQTLQGVPEYYQQHKAVSAFIHYLETFQANTLAECIKLYQTDLRHQENMDKLEEMNRKLHNIELDIDDTNYRIKNL